MSKSKTESVMDPGVLVEVRSERIRQDATWGEQNHHPLYWLAILGEEVGEANEAALRQSYSEYRKELLQVAAVAVAAIESFDRQAKLSTGPVHYEMPESSKEPR